MSSRRTTAWIGVSTALLGLALFLLFANSGPHGADPTREIGDGELEAASPRADDRASATIERAAAGETKAAPQVASPGVAANAAKTELATMRGRFLLPLGAPAAGVNVRLSGSGSNSELERVHGRPIDWSDLEIATDEAGHFELRFDPPPAFQFFVDARLGGFGRASWRWGSLAPSSVTDLGDVTLATAGRIEGRLTDRAGRPVHGIWAVSASASLRAAGPNGDTASESREVDPTTGAFVFPELPPGSTHLSASSRQGARAQEITVEVRGSEITRAQLFYKGPDLSRRITINTFCRPLSFFEHQVASIVLLGSEEGPRRTQHDAHGNAFFDDLDPQGEYMLEIADPKFLSVVKRGLRAGTSCDVTLTGSAGARLSVRNAADGARITAYRLALRYRNVFFATHLFAWRALDAPEPEDALYPGIVPGDLTLLVESPGFAPAVVDVDALASNETRAVEVLLQAGGNISGVVVRSDGTTPVPGAQILVQPGIPFTESADPLDVRRQRRQAREQQPERCRETRSDLHGSFAVEGLLPGTYQVTARASSLAFVQTMVQLAEHGPAAPIVLQMPPVGFLEGRISGSPPRLLELLRARVELANAVSHEAGAAYLEYRESVSGDAQPIAKVDAEGGFRLGPLRANTYRLILFVAASNETEDAARASSFKGSELRLGDVVITGDAKTQFAQDLGARALGHLRVRAFRAEGPAAAISVSLSRDWIIADASRNADEGQCGIVSGQTNEQGELLLGPVFGGEWQVFARTQSGAWELEPAAEVVVLPEKETPLRLEIALHEHEVEVVDELGGTPLIRTEIELRRGDRWSCKRHTDERGRLSIELMPGDYRASIPSKRPCALRWTLSGPEPRVLKLSLEPASR